MDVERFLNERQKNVLKVEGMSDEQKHCLAEFAMRMYSLGRMVVADIQDVKYDGRLVILDDGSRWEVDSCDAVTASLWSAIDKVLVADGEMWKLDEFERVSVSEDD